MLALVSLLLLVIAVSLSLLLAETAFPDYERSLKLRLIYALHRIAQAQRLLATKKESPLLLCSLTCSLLSVGLIPQLAFLLSPFQAYGAVSPLLFTGAFAPLILLGLICLLQVAGEVCLALTEQHTNPSTTLLLNSFFWLPLLLAWAALGAYLPVDSPQAAHGAESAQWLFVLQPLGCLTIVCALISPYLLSHLNPQQRIKPVQNWLRELRMIVGIFLLVSVSSGRTCFATAEPQSTLLEAGWVAGQILLIPLLLWITVRLKSFLQRRADVDPLNGWHMFYWLALLSVTASFLAFHLLGMSDHWMHVLMNFSLLAIWVGFIVPKYPLGTTVAGRD